MAEAFTAGVKPGGLTDDTQIRILLCYLVKTAGPLTRDTLQGALLQEQLVNYFEFADALADVEKQQLVTVNEEEQFVITQKGTTRVTMIRGSCWCVGSNALSNGANESSTRSLSSTPPTRL